MTRTVMDVDRELLTRAQEILGQPSKTATINEALRRVVADQAQQSVFAWIDNMDDEQADLFATVRERMW